jgi:hypothetical protein
MARTKAVKIDPPIQPLQSQGEELKPIVDPPPQWKKLGGGTLRLASGETIRPGHTFRAYPYEIPMAFRDVVVPLTPLPPDAPLKVVPTEYSICEQPAGSGQFVVIDASGKVISEKSMLELEAVEMAEKLNGRM